MKNTCRLFALLALLFCLAFASACDTTDDDDAAAADDDDDDDDDNNDNNDNNDDNDDDNDDNDNDDNNDDDVTYRPLFDEDGRQILLHGANYMGMEFGWFNHQPEDFVRMAAWGFNVVRLPIAWAYLEPEPGVWDDTYLTDVVAPVVQYANDAGLRVILDMHQWQWCAPCGGNGIPPWICEEFGSLPNPWDFFFASGDFWTHPEYLDDFVEAWDRVSAQFGGSGLIWAYDLFNEPLGGLLSLPWTFENPILRPLYVRFIDVIRANDPDPYILVEPSMAGSLGLPFVMDPLPYERLVFEPHLYPWGIANGADYTYPPGVIERFLRRYERDADRFGTPFLVGETGIVASVEHSEDWARDASDYLDRHLTHWTWWVYWEDDSSFGLLNDDGTDKEKFVYYLNRPYPRATMGRLISTTFDPDTKEYVLEFANDGKAPPDTRIFMPLARHYPDGFDVDCSDPEGAWSWSFDDESSEIVLLADPDSDEHTVTITAAR
jgi:endoglycosylceramidase